MSEAVAEIKKTAVVFCQGGARAMDAYAYSGIASCQSAMLIQGGYKKCVRACLGFGDCRKVCKFNAIFINENGVAEINPDKCADCGMCLKICPKEIIQRAPRREVRRVLCSNHDTAQNARESCVVACDGCGECVRQCPFQAVEIQHNLASINPDKCTNCGECVAVCPTGAIG